MVSPGQEFKKEREARGLSIKDVADATRITGRYIEAIEADRLDLLPGGFFVKGMLRNYAKAVGLDEEQVIEKYKRIGAIESWNTKPSRDSEAEMWLSRKQRLSLAGYAAAILVITSFAVYFLTKPRHSPQGSRETEAVSASGPQQAVPQPEARPAATAPQQEEETGVRIDINFRDATWIQVYADGRLVLDGLKMPGTKAQVKADQELLIHLGNAGGLDFTLNGKPGKSFGRSGAVVKNIRIALDNMNQFVQNEGSASE